ncbi:phospholipase D-like domain-containing protein, partial [Yersinia pestis]|uniref:phospholipase D-like domain-containing protein n=1 Tax=Yersinia pestis TaxID=632 RepID=UPI001EE4C315
NDGMVCCRAVDTKSSGTRQLRCPDFVIHYRLDRSVNAGIPVRTVNSFKALHDKVIIVDGKNTQMGSFNFSQAAVQSNSENVLIIWGDFTVVQAYLQYWQSRWNKGTDWRSSY